MIKTSPLPWPSEIDRQPAAPITPCIQALTISARPPAMPMPNSVPACVVVFGFDGFVQNGFAYTDSLQKENEAGYDARLR
jgi:hypothetical protein